MIEECSFDLSMVLGFDPLIFITDSMISWIFILEKIVLWNPDYAI